ncbi:hypothetical protein TsFJ059_007641 [Trichoderma semiorbis]|uniref:Uncharacterized protein n=1 Tax=Trichoderma semiorbis TaxID=1491008 RepID=A0A9P8HBS6_9HYPO|nr:hypothetical protein TsFJ059_007641 [Trichoderma semiorbis]
MAAITASKDQIALNLENGIVDAALLVNLAPIIRPCSSASFIAPLDQEGSASRRAECRLGDVTDDRILWLMSPTIKRILYAHVPARSEL